MGVCRADFALSKCACLVHLFVKVEWNVWAHNGSHCGHGDTTICDMTLLVYREGKIETELLYPILLRSGLPREVLGQLWGLVNRQTPGQLVQEELFALLALISLVQVGVFRPRG